jgi:hypothetical protein
MTGFDWFEETIARRKERFLLILKLQLLNVEQI